MLGTTIQEFLDQKAAEGEAKGMLEILLLEVEEGERTRESAIKRIDRLVQAGRIPASLAQEALSRLA